MSAGPKSILCVSHSAELYGAERSFLDLVTGLPPSLRPTVVLPGRGPMVARLERAGIPHFIIPSCRWFGTRNRVFRTAYRTAVNTLACLAIKSRLKSLHSFDLIYSNTSSTPIGGVLALLLGCPHVWHIREFVEEDFGATFDYGAKLSLGFINRSANVVVCNSEAVARKFSRSVAQSKIRIVYNGLLENRPASPSALHSLPKSPDQPLTAAIVGRIQKAKGHSDALKAVHDLVASGFDFSLVVAGAGEGSYPNELRALAQDLGIQNRVFWLGFVENTEAVFRSADVAFVCSKSEAFGRVAVEAMSVGCPVIGAKSGAITEIITDGVDGLLYEPGDRAGFVGRIRSLFGDSQLYSEISRNSVETAYRRFTKRRYIEDMISAFNEVWCVPANGRSHPPT